MWPFAESYYLMTKRFCLIFLVSLFLVSVSQATDTCDAEKPDWKLSGTNCSITPYFYETVTGSTLTVACSCGEEGHNYTVTGEDTVYSGGFADCKEPSYSRTCGLLNNYHPYWEFGLSCPEDTHPSSSGAPDCTGFPDDCPSVPDDCSCSSDWNGNVYTANHTASSTFEHSTYSGSINFNQSWTTTAVFDRDEVPEECFDPGPALINGGKGCEEEMWTNCLCGTSGKFCCSQKISISCAGSSFYNASLSVGGDELATVYRPGPGDTWIKTEGFSGWNCCDDVSSVIRIVPKRYKGKNEDAEMSISFSLSFCDMAGNAIDSESASVTVKVAELIDMPSLGNGGK